MPLALLALVVATFAMGTTEFIIVGLIPDIARDLSVSTPAAGLLVSIYALSIMLGAPTFTALTGHIGRRPLLLGLMLVFAAGNIAAGFAPGYGTLMAARIVVAVTQGVFFSVAAVVATSLVHKSKVGGAQGVLLSGVTVAMVVGVPFGTCLGQMFGWRMPFLVIGGLGVIALVALAILVPRKISHLPPSDLFSQLKLLGNPKLLKLYSISALGFGSTFVVFTFLSPLLTGTTKVNETMVSVALLIFGGSNFVGSLMGGKLTDAVGMKMAMFIILAGLAVSLALIPVTAHNEIAVFVNIGIWGIFGFAVPPVMQAAVVSAAQQDNPAAVGTASGFNIAAFNLGISGGSFIGGQLFATLGVLSTPTAAMGLAVLAMVMVAMTSSRSRDELSENDLPIKEGN